jgi:hypothetical protein
MNEPVVKHEIYHILLNTETGPVFSKYTTWGTPFKKTRIAIIKEFNVRFWLLLYIFHFIKMLSVFYPF